MIELLIVTPSCFVKLSVSDLNLVLSVSKISWYIKVWVQTTILFTCIWIGKIFGFILFSKCEMQPTSTRIWTRITDSLFNNDNCHIRKHQVLNIMLVHLPFRSYESFFSNALLDLSVYCYRVRDWFLTRKLLATQNIEIKPQLPFLGKGRRASFALEFQAIQTCHKK